MTKTLIELGFISVPQIINNRISRFYPTSVRVIICGLFVSIVTSFWKAFGRPLGVLRFEKLLSFDPETHRWLHLGPFWFHLVRF